MQTRYQVAPANSVGVQSTMHPVYRNTAQVFRQLSGFRPALPMDRRLSVKLSTLWDVASVLVLLSGAVLVGCSLADTKLASTGNAEANVPASLGSVYGPRSDSTFGDTSQLPAANPTPQPEPISPLAHPELSDVNPEFFYQLVDDLFHAQNPQLERKILSQAETVMEASLREEWWQTAETAAASLNQIQVFARQNLGSYQPRECHAWHQDASDLGINPNTVKNAVSNRFQQLFPALAGYENGPDTSGFQLWCAIAQEEAQKIRQGHSFE